MAPWWPRSTTLRVARNFTTMPRSRGNPRASWQCSRDRGPNSQAVRERQPRASENAVVANDNGVFYFRETRPFFDALNPEGSSAPEKFFLTTGDKVQYFVLSSERLSSEVVLGVGDCGNAGLSFFHPGEVRGCFVPWHC